METRLQLWKCYIHTLRYLISTRLHHLSTPLYVRTRMHAYTPSQLRANELRVSIRAPNTQLFAGMQALGLLADCIVQSGKMLLPGPARAANQVQGCCCTGWAVPAPALGTGLP